jgi:acetyl esterase/lipase
MAGSSADILTAQPPPDADVRLAYGDSPIQFGDLRLPAGDGPHPLVVVVHGGYWQAIYNLTHAGHLCVDLADHGIATWNVEYRRIGDPGGGHPGTIDDVAAAFAFVRELGRRYPLDLDRVAAFGHSAGGHLALLAGERSDLPLRGVVSAAGVVDLHETHRRGDDKGLIVRLLGGGPDELPDRWREASPRQRLPLGLRQVLAVGTADVHCEPNEGYAEATRAAGDEVELITFDGAGHFELIDPAAAEWQVLRARLELLTAARAVTQAG